MCLWITDSSLSDLTLQPAQEIQAFCLALMNRVAESLSNSRVQSRIEFERTIKIFRSLVEGVTQQRHSLLNVSRIYQEIGEEHLRIKQIGAYRQSLLVRGLGTAILLAPAKLECCV